MENSLPYEMPKSLKGQIKFISSLIKLPESIFSSTQRGLVVSEQSIVEILVGVVTYHMLDRHQQRDVLVKIRDNFSSRPAYSLLLSKITDPMVNKYWGLWSVSSDDLKEMHHFRSDVGDVLGYLGMGGLSITSASDLYKKVVSKKIKGSRLGHPALIILGMGFYYMNDASKSALQDELMRRVKSHEI